MSCQTSGTQLSRGHETTQKGKGKRGKQKHAEDVKIPICGKDGKPKLIFPKNEEETTLQNLKYIFEDVKDMPVAIYSISGAFRKGKSFLLNLFIKYMEKLEKGKAEDVEPNWMDGNNSDLKGFSWGGGMEANTQGILIYSKPFVIQDAKGQEVAVFLMDTQGLFDSKSSMTQCSSIFALSTLISSMQIYNLSQQIQEDNLQYLQLFTDYGQAIRTNADASKHETPFQNLLFLIRDWPHQSEGYGFEAGQKVLKKVFAVKEGASEDLTSVRKHIKASFETVKCFLMPHPGREIANRKDGDNKFEPQIMDADFKTCLNALVTDLFSSNNLALKQIGGKSATGQNMIDYISGMLHNFNPKSAPHIRTLFQSAAEQTATKTLDECDKFCQQQWNEIKDPNAYMEDNEIDLKGKEIEAKVLEHFRNHVLLGEQSFIDGLQEKLRNRINQQKLLFKQENQQIMNAQIKKIDKEVEDAAKEFQNKLQAQIINVELFDHEQLKQSGAEIETKILNEFDKDYAENARKKYFKRLKEEIQRRLLEMLHTSFLEQLNIKQMMENLVQKCWKQVKDEMQQQESLESDLNKFTTQLETAQGAAFDKFDEESKQYDKTFCDGYRNKLQRRIEDYVDLNKLNKEQERIKLQENIKKAEDKYKEKQSELNQQLNEEALDAFHEQCKEAARDFLKTCQATPYKEEFFAEQLKEFYENQLKFLQYKNEELKNKVVLEINRIVINTTKEYSSKMAQVIQDETNQSEHEEKHKEALNEALAEFEKSVEKNQHLDAQKDECRNELKAEIMKQYNHNSLQLVRQKEFLEEKMSNLLGTCVQMYSQYMSGRLKKAVSDDQFEEFHEFALELAQHHFDNSISVKDSKLKEKQKVELVKRIQLIKMEILEANKNKQVIGKRLAAQHLQESLQSYQMKMQLVCSRGYVDIQRLIEEHNRTKKAALDNFKTKASGQQLYEFRDFEGDLAKTIESEWITMFKENKNYKKLAEYQIKERATELLNSCTRQLQEKLQKVLPNKEYLNFCDELKKQILQEFNKNIPENLLDCFKAEQERLENNLKTDFLHVLGLNNQNLKELEIRLKESEHLAISTFNESFEDVYEQYLHHEELEKRIKKEKRMVLQSFQASVHALPEHLVEPVRSNLEKNLEKSVTKIKHENLKNQKHIETYAELVGNQAITLMKLEKTKILNDQVDVATARYKASDAMTEAMDIFEKEIGKMRMKFDVRKYQQDTKSALFRLKKDVIEEVNNQTETKQRCIREATEAAIKHVRDELSKFDVKQTSKEEADRMIANAGSEAMETFQAYLQSLDVKYDTSKHHQRTWQELEKIKKECQEKIGKLIKEKEQKVTTVIADFKTKYATQVSQAVYQKWFRSGKRSELDRVNKQLVAEYTEIIRDHSNGEKDECRLLEALQEEYDNCYKTL